MENQNNQIPYAGFWRRVASYYLDWALALPFLLIILVDPMIGLIIVDIVVLILLITNIIFYFKDGQTIGKKILNIKIISTKTGEKPGAGALIGRFLGKIVSAIPLYLGLLWIGWDDRKQGWHDKMASTTVVRFDNEKWSSGKIWAINIGYIVLCIGLSILTSSAMIELQMEQEGMNPATLGEFYESEPQDIKIFNGTFE